MVNDDLNMRVSEERSFHNHRFSVEIGSGVKKSKYYKALECWYSDYFLAINGNAVGSVLEIGSGTESIALNPYRAAYRLYSIDISEEAVAYAKEHNKHSEAEFTVDDAHHTKFENEFFDLVIGRGILHHLEIDTACKEIKRVLKSGGRVVFGEPLDCNMLINAYRKLTPHIRSRDERPLAMSDLRVLCHYFGDLDVRYYGFLTLGPALFGFRSPRFLHHLDDFLLNKLGLGRFLAWACLITSPLATSA